MGVSIHGGTPKSLGLPLFQETSISRGHNVVDRPNDLLLRTVGVIEAVKLFSIHGRGLLGDTIYIYICIDISIPGITFNLAKLRMKRSCWLSAVWVTRSTSISSKTEDGNKKATYKFDEQFEGRARAETAFGETIISKATLQLGHDNSQVIEKRMCET